MCYHTVMKINYKTAIPAAALIVVLLLTGGFLLYKNQKTANKNPQQAGQDEVRKVVEEVRKLMDLPNETPTVATVVDITKLKDQPFFQKAKNGDKVLIYTAAQKAILYDPVAKRIKEVGPVNAGSPSAQVSSPQTATLKIALLNGTKTVGLASKVEEELKSKVPGLNVVSKDNAKKDSFEKTVVIVLNQLFLDSARNLASLLNATLGNLPEGEEKPKDGDILIILGKDRT
ncbi:MAG: hypothetical protein US99_C0086G0006 [Candidatus Daviesbacteria bacterium GW2011_GWF2_38_6]|uniref:LytR/CpsA/Psr regulator C-terminal domain-containing protein n=1 Tax=Candidatus Daviesbacteria bacterium GW2011_GWF2_38_6 TaxID=1618432 RepID=A0A0G0MQY9_9BACT|nr:MAG: hypothetical protein US99_C0086G0006 [Candidatus Daviesbacteria bacterium GW2011_GWF2_38_6]